MVALALAAGLRRGELLGLEWSHIDLEKGTIKVEQTIVRGKAGKPVLKPPKRNQTRIVPISQSVVEELKEYYRYQRKEKMKVLDKWAEYYFLQQDKERIISFGPQLVPKTVFL